jgi:hypothetical protein
MNPSRIKWITVLVTALALIGILMIRSHFNQPAPPDEKAAGLSLLAEKLSGPRFFSSTTKEDGELWIGPSEAREQLPRVAAERKLSPESIREVEKRINQLTAPPPSRIIGGERINLLQLNLALDSVR